MILLSGWKPDMPFLDPMCGTGTFLTESLMMANNIPARQLVKDYCFQNWPDYSEALWEQVYNKEVSKVKVNSSPIFGYEIDEYNLEIAKNSMAQIDTENKIKILNQDFFNSQKPTEKGVMIINPPYGERLSPQYIFEFYQNIGDTLKKSYSGWDAWIISANINALKKIGLRTSKKHTLYNGSLECKFQKYSLFEGSLKK
jgi:putative N6-adenine-specific DNA methylase